MAQMLRFMHWAPVKAEYRVSFQGGTAGEFYCASASISAPAAGPGGCAVEVEVCFEPTAVAEDARDVLLLSSPIGGAAAHQQQSAVRSICMQEGTAVLVMYDTCKTLALGMQADQI